ncbi:MAG: L-fuculokinase [Mangrovibacterium sp.]
MNHEQYFLGIDLGTSYFKAGLFDPEGKLVGLGRQFVPKETDGKVCELPVPVFWSVLRECIGEAMKNAKINPGEIKALSYSSQANSFILFDRNDHPLTPLILWPDQRAEAIDMPMDVFERSDYQSITGLGVIPGTQFCIAKINWFQKMRPQIWAQVRSIMSISDYLVFSLTGHKVSDYSTSAMTGLFHTPNREWWNGILDLFNLKPEYLSLPLKVGTEISPLTDKGAQLIGLNADTRFCLGGLDHHIAAIGAGLPYLKYMSESTGTTLACVSYQEGYSCRNQINIAPGLDDDHYFRMAFCENGAAALEWYQKNYAPGLSIAELLEKAAHVDIGCEGLVANPCSNQYPGLSGFRNIRPQHRHGHFVRSILESTALSLKKIYEMLRDKSPVNGFVPAGGAAGSQLWIKIKVDLLGKEFLIPECNELACLGAAMLGALDCNQYEGIHEIIEKWVRVKEVKKPDPVGMAKYRDWYFRNDVK